MCDHPGEIVNKNKFASVFKEAWESSIKISTISNSFKAFGICPINRSAISAEKLSPSVLFGDTEPAMSNDVNSPPSAVSLAPCSSGYAPSPATVEKGHSKKDLAELEMKLSKETISTYEKRYENGYNLDLDPIYGQWKSLKDQIPNHEPDVSTSDNSLSSTCSEHNCNTVTVSPSRRVSPALKEALKKPALRQKRSIPRPHSLHLPKHMTGDTFIEIMEEKERKKKEEIENKERCKLEREEKQDYN